MVGQAAEAPAFLCGQWQERRSDGENNGRVERIVMECQGHLVVIDGNSLINRALCATVDHQVRGAHRRGLWLTMLFRLWEEQQPDCILVAFDKGPTFRHQEYAEYKAHRKGMPDELASNCRF